MKITYIDHSGFFIELEKCALLFDYYRGEIPTTDKPLYVFVSHFHQDHYNREIFKLKEKYNPFYILADDIYDYDKSCNVTIVSPNKSYEIGELSAEILKSTDSGVAFVVRTEGKTIFHAGDLNLWQWEGESKAYNNNMKANFVKYTAPLKGMEFDAGFIPLDPRQGELYAAGMDYFLSLADFKAVFPMHFWGKYSLIARYKAERGKAAENVVEITKDNREFYI